MRKDVARLVLLLVSYVVALVCVPPLHRWVKRPALALAPSILLRPVSIPCDWPDLKARRLCQDFEYWSEFYYAPPVNYRADKAWRNCKERDGAKGDGKTDDTSALRSCFAKAQSVAYIPPGTYVLSGPAVLHSGLTVRGDPVHKRTLILCRPNPTSHAVFYIPDGARNIGVQDLAFEPFPEISK